MIRAVLFDIDGVLLNSFEAGLHFVGDILVHMGHPRPSKEMLKKKFHLPLPLALQQLAWEMVGNEGKWGQGQYIF